MPGHPETRGYARDGEVIHDGRRQRPAEPAARDLRPRRRGRRGVLPPRAPAVLAPVAAHSHRQDRGTVSERFMREPADHRVPRYALNAARAAPRIILDDTALDDRPIRVESLPDSFEAECVEAAERGEAGRGKGSVEHVEVFRMVSVGTSILGGPRRLSDHRRANPRYTLNCEEPVYVSVG